MAYVIWLRHTYRFPRQGFFSQRIHDVRLILETKYQAKSRQEKKRKKIVSNIRTLVPKVKIHSGKCTWIPTRRTGRRPKESVQSRTRGDAPLDPIHRRLESKTYRQSDVIHIRCSKATVGTVGDFRRP